MVQKLDKISIVLRVIRRVSSYGGGLDGDGSVFRIVHVAPCDFRGKGGDGLGEESMDSARSKNLAEHLLRDRAFVGLHCAPQQV